MNSFTSLIVFGLLSLSSAQQYQAAQQGYSRQPQAAAGGPPANLPGLNQYNAQIAAYQRTVAAHNRFRAPAGGPGAVGGYPQASYGAQPQVPRYQSPALAPQPQQAYRPAPQPQAYQPAPQPQAYQPAPQPQAPVTYGGGAPSYGAPAAGYGGQPGGQPTISHGAALAAHAKAVKAHQAQVASFTKNYGLDIPYSVKQPVGGRAPAQYGQAPAQYGAAPAQQYRPAPSAGVSYGAGPAQYGAAPKQY